MTLLATTLDKIERHQRFVLLGELVNEHGATSLARQLWQLFQAGRPLLRHEYVALIAHEAPDAETVARYLAHLGAEKWLKDPNLASIPSTSIFSRRTLVLFDFGGALARSSKKTRCSEMGIVVALAIS